MEVLKKGVETKMDGLKKGVEEKMNGLEAKMEGMKWAWKLRWMAWKPRSMKKRKT